MASRSHWANEVRARPRSRGVERDDAVVDINHRTRRLVINATTGSGSAGSRIATDSAAGDDYWSGSDIENAAPAGGVTADGAVAEVDCSRAVIEDGAARR